MRTILITGSGGFIGKLGEGGSGRVFDTNIS